MNINYTIIGAIIKKQLLPMTTGRKILKCVPRGRNERN